MITAKNIAKSFGSRKLWSDLSFAVGRGEMTALVGPSGSGKSTLLGCLGTIDNVDSGRLVIAGQEINELHAGGRRRLRRDTVGFLFQNYALVDNATVEFNLEISIARRRDRPNRFDDALEAVGLGGRGDEMLYRLSGGEQQRVALARLMVKKPNVVLADEPTGALDSENADMVMNLLRGMADSGCAIVIATHNKQVENACDSTIVLKGAAAASG